MKFRSFKPRDLERVLAIMDANIPTYFDPTEKSDFKKYLENHAANYIAVLIADNIVACGGFNFIEEENVVRISWDMIHPDFHGKGIGSALLIHRINLIKTYFTNITIVVRTSQMAYKFYQKNGFQLLSIHKDYWAIGFDMYYMKLGHEKDEVL